MTPDPQPTATPRIARGALRVLLLGKPGSGKSTLLGALPRAARQPLFGFELKDPGGSLARLAELLSHGTPPHTEEVIQYPITLQPLPSRSAQPAAATWEAAVIEGDGKTADTLLRGARSLAGASVKSGLPRAIVSADAVVAIVDASTDPLHLETELSEFCHLFREFEEYRSERSTVGGLPVFLVLSKCDLLALPDDQPADWLKEIEERKRQARERLEEFRRNSAKPSFFGGIDLAVAATAAQQPAWPGKDYERSEPFGVAELFGTAFRAARQYRRRRRRGARRLFYTASACTALLAVMLLLMGVFLSHRRPMERGARELLTKVESYRGREPQTPSARLREPLQPRISELSDLENDAGFARLPAEKQAYVKDRLAELREYAAYKEKLERVAPLASARKERDLVTIETALDRLPLPAEHRSDWSQTEAALYRSQRLADVQAYRAASRELEDWYNGLSRQARDLAMLTGPKGTDWNRWQTEAESVLEEAQTPPHRPSERLPDSDLTYGSVLEFERVASARDRLTDAAQRLQRVYDLSAALGLAGAAPGQAPLDLPGSFTAEQADGRLRDLEQKFPRFREELSLRDLPEAVTARLAPEAKIRYDRAVKAGQAVILRQLGTSKESPEGWQRLRSWLSSSDELKAWRVLATVLARLQNPDAADPVTALEAFLGRDHFDLTLNRLVISIPADRKLSPAGALSLTHTGSGEERPALQFELLGEGQQDAAGKRTRYTFQPKGAATLTYRPGETLHAELPVKSGEDESWLLSWDRSRSRTYQFEALARPPRLHHKAPADAAGSVEREVSLSVVPDSGLPAVPALVPDLSAVETGGS